MTRHTILAGDVGGTKTVLALFAIDAAAGLRLLRETVTPSASAPSLEAILDGFLAPGEAAALASASFGVAGPVVAGVAKITNLPWTIAAAPLRTRLGGIPVSLLNDLQATALGALAVGPAAFAVLQVGVPTTPGGAIAVIAPGTGLGEALLVSASGDGHDYRALPSEGGHADFAATTDEEYELVKFLRALHGSHVSVERVLSGRGLPDVYAFCRQASGEPEPAWLTAQLGSGDPSAAISVAALDGKDAACVRTLGLFAEILGAEAGNVALRNLTLGGVVIGGGIPPKILPALQTGATMARFHDKGRFAPWMKSLGVRVMLEPRAALLGAARDAHNHHVSQGPTDE